VKLRLAIAIVVGGAFLTACSSGAAPGAIGPTGSTTSTHPPCETTYPGSPCINGVIAPRLHFATPVPLGTPVDVLSTLATNYVPFVVPKRKPVATVTVSKVQLTGADVTWANPPLPSTPAEVVTRANRLLAQMTAGTKWISVEMTITNTSGDIVGFGGTGGPGESEPLFAANGKFLQEGTEGVVVVKGCPNPIATLQSTPGSTASGCVPLTVPATEDVKTVGMGISKGFGYQDAWYAQWKV
jgi:hypothetical protein